MKKINENRRNIVEKPKKRSKKSKGLNGNCTGSSPFVMMSLTRCPKSSLLYLSAKKFVNANERAQSIKDCGGCR
jgi:hypothetical protein